MTKKDFFQQLKEQLHGHPFRDRFLEELEDHKEDLESDKNLKEKFVEEEMMKKYLGEPKEIKENFLSIMNPFGKLFFVLEALFYGLPFVPISLIAFTFLKNLFYYYPEINIEIPLLIFGVLIFIAGMIFFHYIGFQRFQHIKSTTPYGYKYWFLISFLLSFLILILAIYSELKTDHKIPVNSGDIILIPLLYPILYSGLGYLAWILVKNKKTKKRNIKRGKILNFLKKAFIIYLLLAIAIKFIFLQLDPTIEPNQFLKIIFSLFGPALSLEYLFIFFWGALMGSSPTSANIFTSFYLLVALIIFLGLQSTWVVIKEKKWLTIRGFMAIYLVSLFFMPYTQVIKAHDFKVPTINVSQMIEKQKVGIFYPLLKYFNMDEGSLFRYQVGFQSEPGQAEGFVIKSNTNDFSFISYGSLKGGQPVIDYNFYPTEVTTYTNLPDYYVCDRSDSESCNIYNFINEAIAPIGLPVSSAAFSKDGKWGLISLPNGAYSPEEVYLVDLRQLSKN